MRMVLRWAASACVAAANFVPAGVVAIETPGTNRLTADTVQLDPSHPMSFHHFNPELPATVKRMPSLDPRTGIHVSEVKPGLHYVTEGVYQAAFLVTDEGVMVFDAPPSFADRLRNIIREMTRKPIVYLVYSHGHTDHIGGAGAFSDVPGLRVLASEGTAAAIRQLDHPGVLMPTETFTGSKEFTFGDVPVRLNVADFHHESEDTIIHLPTKDFLIAVDTITPGEVPFMNFGATSSFGSYMHLFDTLLAYDFDHIMTGHVSILGNRDDVLLNRDYTMHVAKAVFDRMQTFEERFGRAFAAIGFENANLAYRIAMEEIRNECAAEIITEWQDKLSVADVWADSHCETALLFAIMHG